MHLFSIRKLGIILSSLVIVILAAGCDFELFPDDPDPNLTNPPTADAGIDRKVPNSTSMISLDGTASTDEDGDSISYSWTFHSIPSGSLLGDGNITDNGDGTASFSPDASGDFVIKLTVSDGTYNSFDFVCITVNVVPIAAAGYDQTVGTGNSITVDALLSEDYDGDNLSYSWVFVSVPGGSSSTDGDITVNGSSASFTPDVDGDYSLQISVYDGYDTAVDTVMVTAVSSGPISDAGPNQIIDVDIDGTVITLNGSASYHITGDTLSYAWSFLSIPDGSALSDSDITNPSSAVASFNVTSETADTNADGYWVYEVRLDVTDTSSVTTSDVVTIMVTGSGDVTVIVY